MNPLDTLVVVGTIARMEKLIQSVIASLALSGLTESAEAVAKEYMEIANDIAGLAALRDRFASGGLPGEDQVPGARG